MLVIGRLFGAGNIVKKDETKNVRQKGKNCMPSKPRIAENDWSSSPESPKSSQGIGEPAGDDCSSTDEAKENNAACSGSNSSNKRETSLYRNPTNPSQHLNSTSVILPWWKRTTNLWTMKKATKPEK